METTVEGIGVLGTPVVPFFSFLIWGVSLLKLRSREKGTLIIKGLLSDLDEPPPQL